MMARSAFKHAVRALSWILLLHIGLTMLLPVDLPPPPQTALSVPPSECAAPFHHYGMVALLRFLLAFDVLAAFSLCCQLQLRAGGDGGNVPAGLRLLFLLAVLLTAAGTGLAMAAFTYLLQVRAGLLDCMSSAARAALYGSYVVTGAVCALTYYDLVRDVLL